MKMDVEFLFYVFADVGKLPFASIVYVEVAIESDTPKVEVGARYDLADTIGGENVRLVRIVAECME